MRAPALLRMGMPDQPDRRNTMPVPPEIVAEMRRRMRAAEDDGGRIIYTPYDGRDIHHDNILAAEAAAKAELLKRIRAEIEEEARRRPLPRGVDPGVLARMRLQVRLARERGDDFDRDR